MLKSPSQKQGTIKAGKGGGPFVGVKGRRRPARPESMPAPIWPVLPAFPETERKYRTNTVPALAMARGRAYVGG
ncbi:MAG: hypothetical protein QOG72_1806 [Sphingomonadales bacterium]|nr:hypothetical protein [Sphingomonadales bacterium]